MKLRSAAMSVQGCEMEYRDREMNLPGTETKFAEEDTNQ